MSKYLIKKETLDDIAAKTMLLSGRAEAISPSAIINELNLANKRIDAQKSVLLKTKGLLDRKTRPLEETIVDRTVSGDLVLDGVETVWHYAFHGCHNLTSVTLPSTTLIRSYAFNECSHLVTADLSLCETIEDSAFDDCERLSVLILRNSIVCTIYPGAFRNTKLEGGTGRIHVPQALLENYKATSGWSDYSELFLPIEGYIR